MPCFGDNSQRATWPLMADPNAAGSIIASKLPTEEVKTAREVPPEARLRPSGALSARGREVVHSKPLRTEKVESATSTLSTKRTSLESIISDSREIRNTGPPIEPQSILPRGSMLPRGDAMPRGSVAVSPMKARSHDRSREEAKLNENLPAVQAVQGLRRTNSKTRMTFVAFRKAKAPDNVPAATVKLKVKESDADRVKRYTKRFGFSGEEEVKRVRGYFQTALETHCDPDDESQASQDEELLPVQGLRSWLCAFSGVEEGQPLGHLMDPDWSKDKCLTEDEFFEWYNNHQWNEELMVPDPLERRVRHFCKKQGYHISDVERVKSAFEKADKDSSGVLDQQEFAACYADLVGVDPSEVVESRFRILWEEVDEDHNGSIDLLEFAKWYLRVNPPAAKGAR